MSNTEVTKHLLGSRLRDYILGGQDGLVNVLGLILGVAVATDDIKIVLIGGLSASFAESISMAAVAYTSSKAARDYYYSQREKENREIEEIPEQEIEEIRQIYSNKGFHGTELENIVRKITSNKEIWLESMMAEELRLFPGEYDKPTRNALVVGISAVIGSLIPLVPFFFLPVNHGIIASFIVSAIALFFIGAFKAKVTIGGWKKSGLEMLAIGSAAALAGYIIGFVLERVFG